jgi:tetratricopeptide (TPR) repeat protein
VLNNLANLWHNQGKLAEAESLYQRALAVREEQYGPHHPLVAQSLNNLASLYRELGKYHEVEEFLQRVLGHCQLAGHLHCVSKLRHEPSARHRDI